MTVRPAVREDLSEIAAMVRELATHEGIAHEILWTDHRELEGALFGPSAPANALVAEVDGSLIGLAIWHRTFSAIRGQIGVWLDNLYVRPTIRSGGIGAELMEVIFAIANGGPIDGSVLEWNTDARRFYERLGARPVEGRVHYRGMSLCGPQVGEVRRSRTLSPPRGRSSAG